MIEKIKQVLSDYTDYPIADMRPDTTLVADMGLSSLDLVSIVVVLEEMFDIEVDETELQHIRNLNDIVEKVEILL